MAAAMVLRALVLVFACAVSGSAQAESLRCNGRIAAEGDSRISVLHKCGEPTLRDSFCEPVYLTGAREPLAPAFAALVVPCQPVDEWLYERGPGQLVAVVRFRGGVVQSIRYGAQPR
jgi:hypothetical protein